MEFLKDHSAGDESGAREILTLAMYRQFLWQMKLPAKIKVRDADEDCRNLLFEIHNERGRPREEIIENLEKLEFEEKNGENKKEPNLH